VADRFHLLQNLSEALDQVFSAHGSALNRVRTQLESEPLRREDGTVTVPVPPTRPPPLARQRAEQRRAWRLANYTQVWELHRHGWSDRVITRQLGLGRMTVTRYLQAPVFPERKGRSDQGRSLVDPYQVYLLERWNAGQRETLPLFREIQRQGYGGSYATVARYTHRLREAQGLKPRQLPRKPLPKVTQSRQRPLTTRRATRLVLQRPEKRTDEDERLILQLQAQHAELAVAIELAREFATIVRQRQPGPLRSLAEARRPKCQPRLAALCQRAARGLCRRESRPDLALEQRAGRRPHQPAQTAEAVDVRPRGPGPTQSPFFAGRLMTSERGTPEPDSPGRVRRRMVRSRVEANNQPRSSP
jgi:hypothetical protein